MAVIEIEKGTEWHVRRQISGVLTDHDNRIVTLEAASGGGGKIAPQAVFDGAGDVILVGSRVRAIVSANATITGWTILADTTGAVVVDVWKDTYANYPPTLVDTITGSAKPAVSSGLDKATSTTLTGWTTALVLGDTLTFVIDSVTSFKQLIIRLNVA